MPTITHDTPIKATTSTVYKALTTAQGLRSWFTPQAEGSGQPGSDWILKFTDQPSFDWKVLSLEDQHKVSWKCLQGPGNSPGTEAEFTLKLSSDNQQCILTISHKGWTKDDPKFDRCVQIWHTLLEHLKNYCETGTPAPAYQ